MMPVTKFLWDDETDTVVMEKDDAGNVTAEYTTAGGRLISQRRNGQTSYYRYDGQGNTRALTDENGNTTDTYTYTAFGDEVATTGTTKNRYRFGGQYGYQHNEKTGDYYVRERVYEPRRGRWQSKDPVRFVDGMNPYVYAGNGPIIAVDPLGLFAVCCSFSKKGNLWSEQLDCTKYNRIAVSSKRKAYLCCRDRAFGFFTTWKVIGVDVGKCNSTATAKKELRQRIDALPTCLTNLEKCPFGKGQAAKDACRMYASLFDDIIKRSEGLFANLPKCPCTVKQRTFERVILSTTGGFSYTVTAHEWCSPGKAWGTPSAPTCCHPGADVCIRQKQFPPGSPSVFGLNCESGQQCCYKKSGTTGSLITDGLKGAGTPDLVAPKLGCYRLHNKLDVCSWACCKEAGMLEEYFKRWKPRGCSK